VKCHANDPKQLVVRDSTAALIRRAQDGYTRATEKVHDATVRGLATDDEQLLLQEAKTQVTQLEAMQHTLDFDTLKPVAARADEITKQTFTDIKVLERFEQWKRQALVPIWGFLGAMALLFWVRKKQLP
jgi:hypothetical protein